MQFDRQLFLEDGYAILRNVIPPERLDKLRASFQVLVDRQQTIWARDPEDPSNHAYKVKQPRLAFQTGVDAATANTVELCLHANTLGVSRQALRDRDAAVSMMFLMCNPATDYGPDLWHRDHHHGPYSQAPLAGLQADMMANGGPGSVQWNIALYEDDVLWVVPGSHRRLNTPQENRELQDDPRGPLSNGMQVELQAGDGVMYINTNLHWPSNYTTKLRRCIHLGYRAFTGQLFPYARASIGTRASSNTCRQRPAQCLSDSPSWTNANAIGLKRCFAQCSIRMPIDFAKPWPCCTPGRRDESSVSS